MSNPALQPVLTQIGQDALINAQLGQGRVVIDKVAFGRAARLPLGDETGVADHFLTWPIASGRFVQDGQIDLSILVEGSQTELADDQPVRELAFLDETGRAIFYWSTTGSLGAVSPAIGYALTFSIKLAPADAQVIEIISQGTPWEALFGARFDALEAAVLSPTSPLNRELAAIRDAGWRNLFLSQA